MKSPLLLALTFAVGFVAPQAAENPPPRIDVLLWFDTEDYLLPADDDACLRLANLLQKRGIRATFKVVGERRACSRRAGGKTSSRHSRNTTSASTRTSTRCTRRRP